MQAFWQWWKQSSNAENYQPSILLSGNASGCLKGQQPKTIFVLFLSGELISVIQPGKKYIKESVDRDGGGIPPHMEKSAKSRFFMESFPKDPYSI